MCYENEYLQTLSSPLKVMVLMMMKMSNGGRLDYFVPFSHSLTGHCVYVLVAGEWRHYHCDHRALLLLFSFSFATNSNADRTFFFATTDHEGHLQHVCLCSVMTMWWLRAREIEREREKSLVIQSKFLVLFHGSGHVSTNWYHNLHTGVIWFIISSWLFDGDHELKHQQQL